MPTIRVWRRDQNRVETLGLEEYLRGVVPAEMPTWWPIQALMAQAVAARTYAMRAIESPRHHEQGADLCDTACCQAYKDERYEATDRAVAATAGVTWPDPCQYVSQCGRPDCPLCNGANGYNGQTWTGRMCQEGARHMAERGATWREILALYYGPDDHGAQIIAGRWNAEEAVRQIEGLLLALPGQQEVLTKVRQRLLEETITALYQVEGR
jgi:hypothetical protein